MWCYIQNDLLQTSTSSIPQTVGGWLSHKPDYHKTPPPLLTMMSCYILKQTSTKVNLLNSPNKNPKISSLGDNCSPPNFWSETQKTKPTKQNKQTNKNTRPFGDIMIMLPPLPPPLPQTVIPYWNCDAICQIRLGKYRPFPSPSRILCFLAKIDPFPKNYNSFNEIDRPTIDIASFSKIIIILSCKTQSLEKLNTFIHYLSEHNSKYKCV